jgi:hypothetical protein
MRKDMMRKTGPRCSRSLMKIRGASFKWLAGLLVFAFMHASGDAIRRAQAQQRVVKISQSPLVKMLRDRMDQEPRLSEEEEEDYANRLLSQYGFDYQFDVCEFIKLIPQKKPTQGPSQYRFQMTRADGGKVRLETGGDAISDGMCGECFFSFPAQRVTKAEIVLQLQGERYRLRRPRLFNLDKMTLVDGSMKRALRTWEVPYQSVPLGISADGMRLYLETEFERLALEIAPSGISFKSRSRVEIQNGKEVTGRPRDPNNAYLGFMRFSKGRQSYIIRYSAPCT